MCDQDQVQRCIDLRLSASCGDFIKDNTWLVHDEYQVVGGFRGMGKTMKEAIDDWCEKHPEYKERDHDRDMS